MTRPPPLSMKFHDKLKPKCHQYQQLRFELGPSAAWQVMVISHFKYFWTPPCTEFLLIRLAFAFFSGQPRTYLARKKLTISVDSDTKRKEFEKGQIGGSLFKLGHAEKNPQYHGLGQMHTAKTKGAIPSSSVFSPFQIHSQRVFMERGKNSDTRVMRGNGTLALCSQNY